MTIQHRLIRFALPAIGALAAAGLVYGTVDAGAWALRYARIWRGEFPGMNAPIVRSGAIPALALQDSAGRDSVRFDEGKALILVFDARCSVCGANAPRWMDLVMEARRRHPDVRVYALPLTRNPIRENATYWNAFRHVVTTLDPRSFEDALAVAGGTATPITVAVRNGQRVGAHLGYVGDRRRDYLLAALED